MRNKKPLKRFTSNESSSPSSSSQSAASDEEEFTNQNPPTLPKYLSTRKNKKATQQLEENRQSRQFASSGQMLRQKTFCFSEQ